MSDEIDKKLMKRIVEKKFDEPIDEEAIEKVLGVHMKAYCKTCKIIFLDIPFEEYNRLHSWKGDNYDKWFVETAIHWFELQNPHHEIVLYMEIEISSISDIWKQKFKDELERGKKQLKEKSKEETLKRILEYLYKHRERVRNRPI